MATPAGQRAVCIRRGGRGSSGRDRSGCRTAQARVSALVDRGDLVDRVDLAARVDLADRVVHSPVVPRFRNQVSGRPDGNNS